MFYRDYDERLKHCESTSQFCTLINDMFDALNKTLNGTGLTLGCAEMKVFHIVMSYLYTIVYVRYCFHYVLLFIPLDFRELLRMVERMGRKSQRRITQSR